MTKALRVESIELPYHQALSIVCHQAKNLYNRANFLVKQALRKEIKFDYKP